MLSDYQTLERMGLKRQAIPIPDLHGKRVLDIGCDHGYWSFDAADKGAMEVLGLDRGREVKGVGPVDLVARNNKEAVNLNYRNVRFERIELGRQWREFGKFDIVYLFSLYHHIFEQCGDHDPIWFWLWRNMAPGGVLLWENPVDDEDSVVRRNVSDDKREAYYPDAIFGAAARHFDDEYIGPALHEPTREVWRFRPRILPFREYQATARSGAGGAAKAFEFAEGRRIAEIEAAIGIECFPGSLNLVLDRPFDWDRGYFRARISDVMDRKDPRGLDQSWAPRWARFYPVRIAGEDAYVFRFEGERYPENFVELIASRRLRDAPTFQDRTILCAWN